MSLRASNGWPIACSGERYSGVPSTTPTWLRPFASGSGSRSLAMPKSSSRACSPRGDGVSTTFSGLRSRWMIPLSWMAPSPSASCISTRRPRSGARGPLPRCWRSVSPSANSITRQVESCDWPKSMTRTTAGCSTLERRRASRRKRSLMPGCCPTSRRSTFNATRRPRLTCSARYTSPMPPPPRWVSTRKRSPRTSEFGSSTANRTLSACRASPRCRPRAYPATDRPEKPLFWGAWGRVVPSPTAPFMASEDTSGGSAPPAAEGRAAGPELRLLDRRAFVGFPPVELRPGVNVVDFGLQIPDVSFPFNVGAGVQKYQRRKLHFGFLEVAVDAELIRRSVQETTASALEVSDVALNFRQGWIEGAAALPDVEVRGSNGFSARMLPQLVQKAAVSRGFRMPSLDGARLAGVEVSPLGLRLRFASGALPPPALLDEELLLTLEGARSFAEAEALVAAGKLAEARDAYLRGAGAEEAHPFALERLLALLIADPASHEYALDVLETLARRRPASAAPLWAEAIVRERRGEPARSAERWLALVELARKRGDEASAFSAAQAAARVAEGQAPQMAVKALHAVLGIRPDHLPALRSLARAADQAQDRAGALRAYRRLSALARDPLESADAHVQLARLSALSEDDVAGARLHCEAALKLAPDLPAALELLGELCARAGEPLRALKAFDG